ncbi:MAG: hypothetical protein WCY93_12125 [Anaerolineaceae bacterium]
MSGISRQLDELLDLIRDDTIWYDTSPKWGSIGLDGALAVEAFFGSVEAAKKLHETALSDLEVACVPVGLGHIVYLRGYDHEFWSYNQSQARAYLMTILKALKEVKNLG